MAATKKFNVSTSNANISGYVEIIESDVSTPNNDSDVTATLYLRRTNIYSGITASYNCNFYITIDGTEYTIVNNGYVEIAGNSSSSGGAYTKVGSATKTNIKHNDDGSKTVSVSVRGSMPYASSGITVSSQSDSIVLTTIPRASSVSSSSPYIGDLAIIIISSASSSFTHTLTYSFGSASGTIATKTSTTTVAWNTSSLKASLYAQIPNAKSGSGTITCQTYSGNTLVGTKTCGFNLYAKESDCKPSISGSVVDTNSSTIALTGNSAVMVRYMSKPKVTISATANYSSSIKSYSINVAGQTSNSSEATFDTISSNNITISVTDSRGYSNSKTLTPSIINYVKLTSNLTIERPEQTSNEAYLNGSGQWFNGNFSSSNTNTLTINSEYRKSGDSSWTSLGTLMPTISGNTFSFSNLKLGDSFDYKNEYQFRITIADKLQTIGNQTKDIVILSTGKAIVRIGKNDVIVNGNTTLTGKTTLGDITNNIHWNTYGENIDANNCTQSGTYYLGSGCSNTPNGLTYVRLFVSGYNGQGDLAQIAMPVSSNEMWVRTSSNSSWKEWRKVPLIGEPLNVSAARGSWNAPTRGVLTVQTDNSGAQHSALVGLNSAGARLYGIDLLDSDVSPQLRIYVGSRCLEIDSSGNIVCSGALYGHQGGTRIYGAKTLYNNSSGTNGTVTLNENSANFDYLEIFFKDNTGTFSSVRMISPDGEVGSLTIVENTDTWNYYMNIKNANIKVSGTTITKTNYKETNINAEGGVSCVTSNVIYITKVLGYR